MDPTYGDDLWSAGFSSDEEDGGGGGRGGDGKISGGNLDLLASLMAAGEEEEDTASASTAEKKKEEEKKETFEEALTKTEDVSLMKAKMKAMEEELRNLRQQVTLSSSALSPSSSTTSHTHQTRPRPQAPTPRKSPPTPVPPSSSSSTKMKKSGGGGMTAARERGEGVRPVVVERDRAIAENIVKQRKNDEDQNISTDVFSGLRIKNPLVSGEVMRKRMEGRKMIKIPNIASRVRGSDVEGDWVTIGVVVDKLPPRDSAKGNKYAVWKVSDLSSQSAVVSLFLFGKSYQEHWKMVQGSVIALLNPTVMPNRETGTVDTSSKQLALSLDVPQKLMRLGVSQDFTICRATTKAGRKCSNFAKYSDGGFCDFHIQGAYKKIRTGRMDCQGGYGPSAANIRGKLFKDSKTDVFYYGGKSYTAGAGGKGGGGGSEGGAGGGQDKRLFARGARESLAEVTHEMAGKRKEKEAAATVSLKRERGVATTEGGSLFQQMLQTQRPGALLLNKHLQRTQEERKKQAEPQSQEKTASELLKEEKVKEKEEEEEGSRRVGSTLTQSSFQPRLGRGLGPGSVVDFNSRPTASAAPPPPPRKTRQEITNKLKAAAVLRQKQRREKSSGGSDDSGDILRRVEENREKDEPLPSNVGEMELEGDSGPYRKRRKLDSAEIEKVLNAKSSHDWAAKEVEWEREEQYFTTNEKKENMERKLCSIRELSVYVSQCKQCDYVAEHASDLCVKEGHTPSRYKAVKRCFECQECHERAFTYNTKYPPFPCRKCSSKTFKQTSFYRERKGPKLGAENLLLRGKEEKYLH